MLPIDSCKEWPVPNAFTLSYGGKPLAYMPFVYEHPEYWHKVEAETKGADDDSFWEAGKYVRRMDERLKSRPHTCDYEALAYEHGTHFVLPESLLRIAFPVGLKFILRFIFKAAKEYPDECEATRKDIDIRLSTALAEWIK